MRTDALIAIARKHVGAFALSKPTFTAASVASALVTAGGSVFTGVCVDVASGIGFCAEHSAVAAMLRDRETTVVKIVAVTKDSVIPPCGRCRELLSQLDRRNMECEVVVGPDRSMRLAELLPLSEGEVPFDDGAA